MNQTAKFHDKWPGRFQEFRHMKFGYFSSPSRFIFYKKVSGRLSPTHLTTERGK